MTDHLWLVGLMGAGKTSVGRHLAHQLDMPFLDTDILVAATAGRTVAELWAEMGEEGFRRIEAEAMLGAASNPHPTVIATGGGAVLRSANRDVMRRTGRVVWLAAPAAVLADRIGVDGRRPLVAGSDPEQTLTDLLVARAADYEAAAHHIVDTDGRTIEEISKLLETLWPAT